MISPTIREATPDDAAQIQAIYAPIVSTTMISFELEPPSADEMRRRILHTRPALPWLVCERAGILGYAYASQHRSRAAYQWSVDVSVYVHEQARRMHIGRALYTSLFKLLALQGFFNAYAGIALPNPASVGIHESLGFVPVGVYRGVGYKLGAWHDVGWWQLALQPRTDDPTPPRTLDDVRGSAGWDAAIRAGVGLIRQS
ncbi:MAG TPA: arsinothricin resistance N-acetyltransferase ArsN1 family B [Herpetosiphonaceae bacterium]